MQRTILFIVLAFVTGIIFPSCDGSSRKSNRNPDSKPTVMKEKWGTFDGKEVFLYTLRNSNGITVKISNYGGIITSLLVPDSQDSLDDIVLGYDSLSQYVASTPYFGAMVGRYANRIAGGAFSIDGKKYTLARNNGNNALHGGVKGFDKVVWDAMESADSLKAQLVLNYKSRDGEEGYPGNLGVTVTYSLTNENELITIIEAMADNATPVNLCNHSYFNLTGGKTDILDHILTLQSDRFTVVNAELIPTGELRPVTGTPMDFTQPHKIGERIEQVPGTAPGGYDHNYVLRNGGNGLSLAAQVEDAASGRVLQVFTTQPGVQFYSGNFLDGSLTGKKNQVYKKHWGMCLETQHFPDSPNQRTFPTTLLKPGETYHQETVWRFGVHRK
jgi:aldose 1-epimerase